MLLSTKFLKDYIDVDLNATQLAEDMTRVGNEYESIYPLASGTNLCIGLVTKVENHPDSDHLHICNVKISNEEELQIVCGAPNVKENIKVIVALVGAKLPNITIKESVIRGIKSCGMLCSLNELGIENKYLSDEEKNGIYILDNDAPIGNNPIKYLELDDEIIDFELTANRGDLLSILGISYEMAAIYNKKVLPVNTTYKEVSSNFTKTFKLNIETSDCKLFLLKKVSNIEIKPSPLFIRNRLIASGIRPINNIVDISNYVMLETGQPLHFYDADTLNNEIGVRNAHNNEELITLDNIKRELNSEDLIITSKTAIGLAGVMGGLSTEITDKTKNILIESAIFDPIKIRYTAKRILKSEASNRFEKGLDPKRTYLAIDRACHLLSKYANATIEEGLLEHKNINMDDKMINISLSKIQQVLGFKIELEDVIDVFNKLGFNTTTNNNIITVTVPTRRLDVNIECDLIEEVGRIYGLDNIVAKLPTVPIKQGHLDTFERTIRQKLISLGLNETLSYTLIKETDALKYTTDNIELIKVLDPMSEERTTLRYSLIPSLTHIYDYNVSHGLKDICIFEIGKSFYKENEEYKEKTTLSGLLSGTYITNLSNNIKVDYLILKGIIESLLDYLGYNKRYTFNNKLLPKNYNPYLSSNIIIDHKIVGNMGKIIPSIYKEDVYIFEIDLDLLKSINISKQSYKEISKYPRITKDLAFIINNDLTSEELLKTVNSSAGSLLKSSSIFDIYEKDNVKSIAIKLVYESLEKTLTEEEINKSLNNLITSLTNKYHIILKDH